MDMGQFASFHAVLEPTHGIAMDMLRSTRGVFRGVVLMSVSFASVRGLLFGRNREPLRAMAQALLCWGILESYPLLFNLAVDAGDSLAGYFLDKARFGAWVKDAGRNIGAFTVPSDGSVAGTLKAVTETAVGMMQAGLVAYVTAAAYFVGYQAMWILYIVTGTTLNLLYVTGPLWIAAGVVGSGRALGLFVSSVFQVLLWIVVPCLALMTMMAIGANADAAAHNISLCIAMNVTLLLVSILSPLVVLMLVRGGIAEVGAAGFGAAVALTMRFVGAAMGSAGGGGAARVGGASAGAGAGGSPSPPSSGPVVFPLPSPSASGSAQASASQGLYTVPRKVA